MMKWLMTGKRIYDKFSKDEMTVYAAQASFFIVISSIPFIMLLLTLIQMIPAVSKSDLLRLFISIMPDMLDSLVVNVIDDLYTRSPGTILSITAITALWSASRGMLSIERGFNRVYPTNQYRSYLKSRLICIAYTFIFMIVCILSLVLLVFGDTLQNFINKIFPFLNEITRYLINLRTILALAIMIAGFTGIYAVVPKQPLKIKDQIPGAVFSTCGWMLFSFLFSLYFNHFSSFSYMYGSLTALVLLMLWLYFGICILFVGAEINYCLSFLKHRRR